MLDGVVKGTASCCQSTCIRPCSAAAGPEPSETQSVMLQTNLRADYTYVLQRLEGPSGLRAPGNTETSS